MPRLTINEKIMREKKKLEWQLYHLDVSMNHKKKSMIETWEKNHQKQFPQIDTNMKIDKYKKLWKSKKAMDEFAMDEIREEIFKRYCQKTGKKNNKITWKDIADAVFSDYIRITKSESWFCTCITCGKRLHRSKIQNGHYRTRGCLKYRFSEDNCRPQCSSCNVMLNGNYRNYHIFISNKFWKEKEKKLRNDQESIKIRDWEYQEKIRERYNHIRNIIHTDNKK